MKYLKKNQDPILKRVMIFIFLVLGYVLLGWVGLQLASVNFNSSPIWPASGFAIGCLIIFGKKYLPAFFVGAVITNLLVETPPLGLLAIALGNTLEAYAGAKLVQWIYQKKNLKHYSELLAVTMAASVASLISATIGASTLYYLGSVSPDTFTYVWYTWWSGDATGILIFLPLLFELRALKTMQFHFTWEKFGMTLLMGACMFFITILVFYEDFNQAFSWILPPLFIFTGIKIGRFASRILLAGLASTIVYLTVYGYGPFETGNQNLDLLYVQCLLSSYAFATLFVRPFKTNYAFTQKFVIGNLIGWSSIFVIIFIISDKDKERITKDLNRTVRQAMESIHKTTLNYETLLNSAEALLRVNPDLTSKDWEEFVETSNIKKYFDALNGLGFVQLVNKKELPDFLKKKYERGHPSFELKILNPDYSAKFQDHFITTFMSPIQNNQHVLGLDFGSESKRREAAWKAQGLRDIVATEPLQLVGEKLNQNSFILLNPIWSQNNQFKGWISAPITSTKFFSGPLENYFHLLRIKIKTKDQTLYTMDRFPENPKENSRYLIEKSMPVFGLTYDLEFYPSSLIFRRNSASLPALALLISLFMLFITGFLLEQITFGQKAEELVKERTKELELSKMQLIQSSKMASLGEMASGMAHEINNPLTIILGKISVIRVMLDDMEIHQPQLVEEIQKIKTTTERIGKIVKGLKTFSRSSDNDPFEIVALDKIIAETLDLCAERFKVSGIEINIDKIPEIFVICRPGQISQVLLNLFNNTFDAVDSLKEKWIHLSFKVKNQTILIFVTDSGKGIPSIVADKIMDPFYTTKDVKKGTGLGLSIAKGIIESHGGQFWFDKDYPNTRFVIELRIEKEHK